MNNLIQQILKSSNPQQMILNMMNPQQKAMAEAFLKKPNREQALQELMKKNNITQQQVDQFKKGIN